MFSLRSSLAAATAPSTCLIRNSLTVANSFLSNNHHWSSLLPIFPRNVGQSLIINGGVAGGTGIRLATKKAAGSTKNGRDSAGRRLGIKVWPGMPVNAGSIIVRQRGQKFRAGDNAGMGKDHTIFAKQPGVVKFTPMYTNRKRHFVHILQYA